MWHRIPTRNGLTVPVGQASDGLGSPTRCARSAIGRVTNVAAEASSLHASKPGASCAKKVNNLLHQPSERLTYGTVRPHPSIFRPVGIGATSRSPKACHRTVLATLRSALQTERLWRTGSGTIPEPPGALPAGGGSTVVRETGGCGNSETVDQRRQQNRRDGDEIVVDGDRERRRLQFRQHHGLRREPGVLARRRHRLGDGLT